MLDFKSLASLFFFKSARLSEKANKAFDWGDQEIGIKYAAQSGAYFDAFVSTCTEGRLDVNRLQLELANKFKEEIND